MEFKRIKEAIESLEQTELLGVITESGIEYLEELKQALSICASSSQLFGKSTVEVDGVTKGKKYKIIFENKETYIFINDYDDADEMYKKYFEDVETK